MHSLNPGDGVRCPYSRPAGTPGQPGTSPDRPPSPPGSEGHGGVPGLELPPPSDSMLLLPDSEEGPHSPSPAAEAAGRGSPPGSNGGEDDNEGDEHPAIPNRRGRRHGRRRRQVLPLLLFSLGLVAVAMGMLVLLHLAGLVSFHPLVARAHLWADIAHNLTSCLTFAGAQVALPPGKGFLAFAPPAAEGEVGGTPQVRTAGKRVAAIDVPMGPRNQWRFPSRFR